MLLVGEIHNDAHNGRHYTGFQVFSESDDACKGDMLYESIIFSASGDLLHSGGVCTLGKFEDRYEYYRYFQNKIFTDGIRNVILLSNFNALSLSRGWYQVKKRDIWRSGWVIMFNIGAVQGPTLFEFRFFRCMYRFSLFSVWMPLDGSN